MSEKLFLVAIETLNPDTIDDDAFDNVLLSLNAIIDEEMFDNATRQKVLLKLNELAIVRDNRKQQILKDYQKLMDEAVYQAQANSKRKPVEPSSNYSDGFIVDEIIDESTEISQDTQDLVRLMIQSEQDGSLFFVFRGVKWSWSEDNNSWNMTQN